MDASLADQGSIRKAPASLSLGQRSAFAVACMIVGFLPVAVGYIPSEVARFAAGLLITAVLLALALLARRSSNLRSYWEIPLAFLSWALFIFADRYVPLFARDPFASTILLLTFESLLASIVVLVVLLVSRSSLGSVYVRRGRVGRAYLVGAAAFVAFYILTYTVFLHLRFTSVNGTIGFDRYAGLTPALLAVAAANAFVEELLFRGILMSRLNIAFGPHLSVLVQAIIFASTHVGSGYTSAALVFVVFFILPLGLICGYLTRNSGSILPSIMFHAGANIPVFLGYLSYVT